MTTNIKIAIDCFNYVGMNGGAGGAGAYVEALAGEMGRLCDLTVIASEKNFDYMSRLSSWRGRLQIVRGTSHTDAVASAASQNDVVYFPFTEIPSFDGHHAKLVTAIHDLQHCVERQFFPGSEKFERDRVYQQAYLRADGVVTFAQTEKQLFQKFLGNSVPIEVIPHAPYLTESLKSTDYLKYNSIEDLRSSAREQYGRYVLYPAVNWPHKNHFRLVEAYYSALQRDPKLQNVRLPLAGATSAEARQHLYQEHIRTLGIEEGVSQLGFVTQRELLRLLAGAEALVFPSLYEGYGIPVAEALTIGTRVIASDLPVFKEHFGGQYIPIANPRSVSSIADALVAALGSTGARKPEPVARQAFPITQSIAERTLGFFQRIREETRNPARARRTIVPSKELRPTRWPLLLVFRASLKTASELSAWHRSAMTVIGKTQGKVKAIALLDCRNSKILQSAQVLFKESDIEFFTITDDDIFRADTILRHYLSSEYATPFCAFITGTKFDVEKYSKISAYFGRMKLTPGCAFEKEEHLLCLESGTTDDVLPYLVFPAQWISKEPAPMLSEGFLLAARAGIKARTTLKPRFLYVEPEAVSIVGHQINLIETIGKCAVSSGRHHLAAVNVQCERRGKDPELVGEYLPWFKSYKNPTEAHCTPSHFAQELASLLEYQSLNADDLVYLHMPSPFVVLGLYQFYSANDASQLPMVHIRLCSDDESFKWHGVRLSTLVSLVKRSGLLGTRVVFSVESLNLQKYYLAHCGVTLPLLLNPVVDDVVQIREKWASIKESQSRARRNFAVRFGYFGEARTEKGFLLLPSVVENTIQALGAEAVQFLIQTSSNPVNDSTEIASARAQLAELAKRYAATSTIRLTGSFPRLEDYCDAIASCDAVLLPYSPSQYKVRGSGVVIEALSLNCYAIVSAGSDLEATFAGPGVVSSEFDTNSLTTTISDLHQKISRDRAGAVNVLEARHATDEKFCNEKEFMERLLAPFTGELRKDRKVALWIGNDVLQQGVSAVYDSQRRFLESEGYDIVNLYVPFPDLNGHIHSAESLEKFLIQNSLGWGSYKFSFNTYSWTLTQIHHPDRWPVLEEVQRLGGSFSRFTRMNSFFDVPTEATDLIRNRGVDLVVLNYAHLRPIVNQLGLCEAKVILETHDIQAYQFAIRASRSVDLEDRDAELESYFLSSAAIAISRSEQAEINRFSKAIKCEWILPCISPDNASQQLLPPKLTLPIGLLQEWISNEALQNKLPIHTTHGILALKRWQFLERRKELAFKPIMAAADLALLSAAHPQYKEGARHSLTVAQAWILESRPDVRAACSRGGALNLKSFERWLTTHGHEELHVDPQGLPLEGAIQELDEPNVAHALAAFAVAGALRQADVARRVLAWAPGRPAIDVFLVASDHPANVRSMRWFFDKVYRELARQGNTGPNVVVAGLACEHLQDFAKIWPEVLLLGRVEHLSPLYKQAKTVAVPVVEGAGTPIKLLDGLAHGCAVSVTEFVDKATNLAAYELPLAKTASDMAMDIQRLLADPEVREQRKLAGQRYVNDNVDWDAYMKRWRKLLNIAKPISI